MKMAQHNKSQVTFHLTLTYLSASPQAASRACRATLPWVMDMLTKMIIGNLRGKQVKL